MIVESAIPAARDWVCALRRKGQRVGFVPTMGALHRGHLSLVEAAKKQCERVALTIFVNPTQFAPNEDLTAYPRPVDADLALCRSAGVDFVFTPAVADMYPTGAVTTIHVARLTDGLCGPLRPGHFDGVATVVAKLFNILPADAAYFGEKDYQQLQVIRRMTADLNMPIEIVGCPTVREADGLATSSRNVYLSAPERRQAAAISRALFAAVERVKQGERDTSTITDNIRQEILAAGPATIEYVSAVDTDDLTPIARLHRRTRICVAVRIGKCRLIDNVAVDAV